MLLPLQITLSQHLLIMDLFQKKSAGRGGGARLVPILGLKYGRKLLRTQAACAHPNQGSNQIPYHMTKETIAPKTERKILWSGWVNKALGLEQSSDGSPSRSLGSVPAAHSLEAGKVTGTEQQIQAGLNPVRYKGAGEMGAIEAFDRGLDSPGEEIVAIGLTLGRKTGMEVRGSLLSPQDTDILGQHGVKGLGKGEGWHGRTGAEIRHHALGMDPGIGAACTMHRSLRCSDNAEFFFQRSLNARPILLPLPAAEVGAVIGDEEANVALLHVSGDQGKKGAPIRAQVSSKPFIRFIFCTA